MWMTQDAMKNIIENANLAINFCNMSIEVKFIWEGIAKIGVFTVNHIIPTLTNI